MEHIVIIGNGIAGVTAARHIRKKTDYQITIISKESKFFFSRTALMYVYMGHMRFKDTQPYEPAFWKKNRIDLIQDTVKQIDFDKKYILLQKESPINYDQLIIATGSVPNTFGWKGENLKGVQGLYSKQDLDLMEENTNGISSAVIVGGGLIGIEMAEMLLSRNISVDYLVRENHFWGNILPEVDAQIVHKEMDKHHGLRLHFSEELDTIESSNQSRVSHVLTKSGKKIDCQFVGLTTGVRPNVDFLRDSQLEINRGILVDAYLSTSEKDVYAIGDCAEFRIANGLRKNIEQVWYTGRMMGETVAQTICGEQTAYQPGNWFNSAKFFDLEYQTYGWVSNTLKENEEEFIWSTNNPDLLLHFIFDRTDHSLIGVNSFGIRLRHELFDHWLTNKTCIDDVISQLGGANFDPEFYKRYEQEIIAAFNQRFNKQIKPLKKSWWKKYITN